MSRFFALRSSRACLGLVALVAIGMGSHRSYRHHAKCSFYEEYHREGEEYWRNAVNKPIGYCGMAGPPSAEVVASIKEDYRRYARYHQDRATLFASAKYRIWEAIPPRESTPNPFDE